MEMMTRDIGKKFSATGNRERGRRDVKTDSE
jgi:hypothetical protein